MASAVRAHAGSADLAAGDPSAGARDAGFTLLEVVIAVLVFGTVFGALFEIVSDNLRKLSVARDELVANELGQQTLREVAARFDKGENVGSESGRYQDPNNAQNLNDMRYELTVTPYSVELPADVKKEDAPLSSIYLPASTGSAPGTPLRRVVVRVFREGESAETAIPLVAVIALPPPAPPDNTNPNDNTGPAQGAQPGARASGSRRGSARQNQ